MTGPTRRDATLLGVQRKVRQNGTLRHLHCPAVCPGQSWRWALLKKNTQQQILSNKTCIRCSGFFSLTWKGPQSEHQEVADDCSEGVTSKRKVTHNATLAETSIATETLGSENKFPFGKAACQCYVSFCECTVSEGVLEKSFPPGSASCSLPIAREPLSTKTIHSRWLNHPFQKQYSFPNFYG